LSVNGMTAGNRQPTSFPARVGLIHSGVAAIIDYCSWVCVQAMMAQRLASLTKPALLQQSFESLCFSSPQTFKRAIEKSSLETFSASWVS
jgi:hypothetical protein